MLTSRFDEGLWASFNRIETAGDVILARTSLFCMIIDVTPPKTASEQCLGALALVVQWMSVFDSSVQRSMHLASQ
mgnify:CR=1 FL=1